MNRIDSGQSIWSDSKMMILKKTKSSGLSEIAAFRDRRGGVKKKKKKSDPPLQTFGKIEQFSSKPYRKVKDDNILEYFRQFEKERRLDIGKKTYNKVNIVYIYMYIYIYIYINLDNIVLSYYGMKLQDMQNNSDKCLILRFAVFPETW